MESTQPPLFWKNLSFVLTRGEPSPIDVGVLGGLAKAADIPLIDNGERINELAVSDDPKEISNYLDRMKRAIANIDPETQIYRPQLVKIREFMASLDRHQKELRKFLDGSI